MANNTEDVKYSFEGDVSSLKNATQQAISLLNKYSNNLRTASSADTFKASQRSVTSMGASLKKLTKDVSAVQGKLKGVEDVKLPANSGPTKAFSTTLAGLSQQMKQLSSTNKITTKDLTSFKAQVNNMRTALQTAGPQIDTLVSKEIKFQNTLNRVSTGVTNFRDKMTALKDKTSAVFAPIVKGVQDLKSTFDPIISKIQSFKDTSVTAFSRTTRLASTVASAFRRTSQAASDSSSSLNKSVNAHKSLWNTIKGLFSGIKDEKKAIKDEDTELDKKNDTLKKSVSNHKALSTSLSNLGVALKQEGKRMSDFAKSVKNTSPATKTLSKVLQQLSFAKLAQGIAAAIKSAIVFIENQNLFAVAMGTSRAEGEQFVDTMQEVYGLDPSNIYRYAGYFYQLTDAIGASTAASKNMSLSLTKMSMDLSSLFNMPIETVVNDLESGMQGMTRAVRKYGMDIRQTTLQQTALTYGISENVATMSEADRQALRFITMVNQAENALKQTTTAVDGTSETLGDFARTIESPANQLKIFKEQITQLGRSIGNFLLVPLKRVIVYINGFVMALRTAITFISSFFGVLEDSTPEIDTSASVDNLGSIGAAAEDAAEKVKNLSAPFDELNVLQESSSDTGTSDEDTGTLNPVLEQAVADMSIQLDNIKMKANEVRDAILGWLGFKVDLGKIISWDPSVLEENLINKFPMWSETIKAVFDNWNSIIEGFKKVLGSIGGVADKVKEKLKSAFDSSGIDSSLATFIQDLSGNLDKLSTWIDEHAEDIATATLLISGLALAFKGFTILSSIVGGLVSFAGTLSSVAGAIGTFMGVAGPIIGIIAAIAGGIYLLYTNSGTFAESFSTLGETFQASLAPMLESIKGLFSTVWEGLQQLWDEHVQPMIEATGDALAPVLDTVGSLWENISTIITDVVNRLTDLWNNTFQPLLGAISDFISGIMELVEDLWKSFIGPVLEYIGDGLQYLWTQFIGPIVQKVIQIVGHVIELLLNLWNNVLQPIVDFLIKILSPVFAAVFKGIWTVIQTVVGIIGSLIDTLLGVFDGIVEFLNGIFTKDWKRALSGLINIFGSLVNGIIGLVESLVNFIIGGINSFLELIVGGFRELVNTFTGLIEGLADLIGIDLDLSVDWAAPVIPNLTIPRVPEVHLASGGVVTSPTQALIGEGKYDEAVIPLGDSPQMKELVQRIADAVDKDDSPDDRDNPIVVKVYIGQDEFDAYTYKASERGKIKVGKQPVQVRG